MQNCGGRAGSGCASAAATASRRAVVAASHATPSESGTSGACVADERRHAARDRLDRVFAGHRQHALARDGGRHAGAAQRRQQFLLDELGLPFLEHEHGTLAAAERGELVRHQRIDDVEHEDRDGGLAQRVREAELLQRADQRVVEPALHDEADAVRIAAERAR